MGDVFQKQIMRGVNLTCVTEYKFKTGCISISLLTQLEKSTAAMNAVLPAVLRRGTARHPDMESIAAVLDELYGARIEPAVRKKGEIQCIGFFSDFPDDAFIPDGGKILEKTANLMGELLLSPATSGGRLRAEYVDGERENLMNDIRAEINDKRRYSIRRLSELMCRGEKYGVSKFGTLTDAAKITVATLTKHYRKVIAESDIEIFYCGAAEPARVEQAMLSALAMLPRLEKSSSPVTEVRFDVKSDAPRYFEDRMDVTQGKLAIGYRLGEIMKKPNYAVMMVMNAVFGGAVTSKLFMNVREKLSLCYYASSMIDRHKGIMMVSSGIEFAKYDEAISEIRAQLDAVRNGDIEDWELDSAKQAVVTSILASMDEPGGLESLYLDRAICGMNITPEELAGLADAVTKEEVMAAAKSVKEDAVYFLRGEER